MSKKCASLSRTALGLLIGGLGIHHGAMAGNFLSLAQIPAGSAVKEPVPNVIITVDDSGSMDESTGRCLSYLWIICLKWEKKIDALKSSLISQFGNANASPPTKGRIPDDSIRLAWQAMHNNGNAPDASQLQQGKTNSIGYFSGQHRKDFSTFVSSLAADGDTPSHQMLKNVYDYMRSSTGQNSPWADKPGESNPTYLPCRRTYHIFMTDGAWNTESNQHTSPGNADGTQQPLGNGSSYDPTSNQTQVYADNYGGDKLSTLADFAFKSWAEDLQPSIDNNVRPLIRRSGTETVRSDSTHSVALQEFWNPKNDPATWQHVTTYTIGFGTDATSWPGSPQWDNTTDNNYAGDYAKLVNNQVEWPDVISLGEAYRPAELWHMALNSRGKYIPARDANALTNAFKEILDIIVAETSIPITGFASASSSIVSSGTTVYQSQYSASGWKGGVVSFTAAQSTGALTPNTAWGIVTGKPKSTGDILDALSDVSSRVIYTYNNGGQQFLWSKLSTATGGQQALLNSSDNKGQDRLNFLRGDRSKEIANGGTFRDRLSREGDIVNSTLWYTSRPASGYTLAGYSSFASTYKNRLPMIYVGATMACCMVSQPRMAPKKSLTCRKAFTKILRH